jgi:fluoride exporter
MTKFLAVFLGGSLGASLRYLISLIAHNYGWSYQGTFVINILGCLFLGFVMYIALQKPFNPDLKLFLTTGIAGGFTTFSTFSYEAFTLIKTYQIMTGLVYMLLSCVIGLAATGVGMFLAKLLNVVIEDSQAAEEL